MMAVLGAAVLTAAARSPSRDPEPEALILFFTRETPDLARVMKEARAAAAGAGIRFRPVFLLDRFPRGSFEPPVEFFEAIKHVGQDVPVVDEEGLELARRYGVRSTPCAVRTGRRAHVAAGTRIDWKELMSCE